MQDAPPCVELVVTVPVEGRFHYRVPEHLAGHLRLGHRVLVPFAGRRVTGFVARTDVAPPENLDPAKLKTVEALLDPEPLVPEDLLELVRFAADYYLAPAGEVLKVALPPGFTGASRLRVVPTAAGRRALDGADPTGAGPSDPGLSAADRAVLERALKAPPRSELPARRVAALLEAGLLTVREGSAASDGGGEVEVFARSMVPVLAEPFLRGAKARRSLYDALSDGQKPKVELERALGAASVRRAAKALLEAGVIALVREIGREAAAPLVPPTAPEDPTRPTLNSEQAAALDAMSGALDEPRAFLLQGVTGSGKTEVYLGLIERALSAGRGAIALVPEIALTPQLEARFRARFGDLVAVLHSGLPDAERRRRWRALRRGAARIALGPRSAVWAPVQKLGVVVVDEEHDPSFKQNTELRYHGRDLALVRARQAGAVALLGSATPSLEALSLVERGRLTRLRLDARVAGRPMPVATVVDLAEERRAMKGQDRLLSRALEDALREGADRGEQSILFLNRRGFNTIVHCAACDDVKKCPRCDVSLTYHRAFRKLTCHYCGFEEPLEARCRGCGARDVVPLGAGTERVVQAVEQILPGSRVARLDRDVTGRTGELEAVIERFRAGEADVLVGTQMVAKGHDFPRVTLVGVVLADAALAFPDFRAAERCFQLLTQVAGRAGRADRPGRVIVQTLQPEHYAIQLALAHDVDRFYAVERELRLDASYPPFSRLGAIRAESMDAHRAEAALEQLAEIARRHPDPEGRIAGPAPAPIGKIRDRHRFLLLMFAPTPARLVAWMRRLRDSAKDVRGADLIFDVDAVELL